jgi:NTP pyrophosphatase (non-canonical NTP hydrolase)
MKLTNEFKSIVEWADERDIFQNANIEKQFIKLQEEIGELAIGIMQRDNESIIDAIGDCVVVLTIIAEMNGTPIEHCINGAYSVIANRKGKMINGTFVKDNQ